MRTPQTCFLCITKLNLKINYKTKSKTSPPPLKYYPNLIVHDTLFLLLHVDLTTVAVTLSPCPNRLLLPSISAAAAICFCYYCYFNFAAGVASSSHMPLLLSLNCYCCSLDSVHDAVTTNHNKTHRWQLLN